MIQFFFSDSQFQNIEKVFNDELFHINRWFKVNKLSVNAKKTNYMLLGNNKNTRCNQSLSIYLDSEINSEMRTPLTRVTSTKFLGLQIDQNITWKEHINNTIKICSRNIGVINKLKHFLPCNALYTLYCSLVLPYINYGILAWGSACSTYINQLYKIQKRALRIISNSSHRSSTKPLLIKYNVLSVEDMYNFELGTFMFKYENVFLPNVFDDLFSKHSDIHSLNTRQKDKLRLPLVKRAFCQKSVTYLGIKLWNDIDDNIKRATTVNQFRSMYKKHLMNNYL